MDQNSMDEFFRMVGFDPDKQGGSSGKTGSAGNVYDVDASEPESVGGDTGGNGRRRKHASRPQGGNVGDFFQTMFGKGGNDGKE